MHESINFIGTTPKVSIICTCAKLWEPHGKVQFGSQKTRSQPKL